MASKSFKSIFLWSLLVATIGWAIFLGGLSGGRDRTRAVTAMSIVGAYGWGVATYFVIPILAFEKLTPFKAIQRSLSILKNRWGRILIGGMDSALNYFMGRLMLIFIFGVCPTVLMVPTILTPSLEGVWTPEAGVGLLIIMLAWGFILWIFLHLIFVTALYGYATTGNLPKGFMRSNIENPWM